MFLSFMSYKVRFLTKPLQECHAKVTNGDWHIVGMVNWVKAYIIILYQTHA